MILAVSVTLIIFALYTGGMFRYTMPHTQDPMWSPETNIFQTLFIVFGIISGSMFFSSMTTRHNRLATLTTPASQLEKFMTYFIIYVPGFIVTFFLSAFLSDLIRVAWTTMFTSYGDGCAVMPAEVLFCFDTAPVTTPGDIFSTVLIYGLLLMLQALFVLGSIFFNKKTILKTACSLFVIMMVCSWVMKLSFNTFFFDNNYRPVLGNDITTSTIWYFASATVSIVTLTYMLAYYRFKETEIIHRW